MDKCLFTHIGHQQQTIDPTKVQLEEPVTLLAEHISFIGAWETSLPSLTSSWWTTPKVFINHLLPIYSCFSYCHLQLAGGDRQESVVAAIPSEGPGTSPSS